MANSRHHSGTAGIVFVTETTATETVAATTLTVSPANAVGNALALWIASRTATAVTTVADTSGSNTWIKDVNASATGLELWYVVNAAAAGVVTVTFGSAITCALACMEFSSINATPLDKATTAGTSGTAMTVTGGSANVNAKDVEIAAFMQFGNANSFSGQTAGFTVQTQVSSNVAAAPLCLQTAYLIVTTIVTNSYATTSGTSALWKGGIASFKSA